MKVGVQQMVEVLLVDPRPLVRQLVADMLEEAGLQVLAITTDAAQAREFFVSYNGPVPEVLVIAAPSAVGPDDDGLNGRALAAELRQQLRCRADGSGARSVGVVYIGGHAAALGADALGAGELFLGEPFGREALVRAVFGVLEREVPRWLAGRKRARPAMHA